VPVTGETRHTLVSLARLLQLWYFLPLLGITTVQADEVLSGRVAGLIFLIAVVVEGLLLLRWIFADIFLVIVAAGVILHGCRHAELLLVADHVRVLAAATNHFHCLVAVRFCLVFKIARIRDWEQEKNSLDNRPSIVADGANNGKHKNSAEGEPRLDPAFRSALVAVRVQVNATSADVAWYLAVTLRNFVVSVLIALLLLELLKCEPLLLIR